MKKSLKLNAISIMLAFIIAHVVLFRSILPLGLIFFAATYRRNANTAAIFIFAALGAYSATGSLSYKYIIAALLFYSAARIVHRAIGRDLTNLESAGAAAAVLFISGALLSSATPTGGFNISPILPLETGFVFVITYIISMAAPYILGEQRLPHTRPQIISIAVLAVFSFIGLLSINIPPSFSTLAVLRVIPILLISASYGPGYGAIAGLLIGGTTGFYLAIPIAGVCGVYGISTGLARKHGQAAILGGFIASNIIMSIYLHNFQDCLLTIPEVIATSLIFLAIPHQILRNTFSPEESTTLSKLSHMRFKLGTLEEYSAALAPRYPIRYSGVSLPVRRGPVSPPSGRRLRYRGGEGSDTVNSEPAPVVNAAVSLKKRHIQVLAPTGQIEFRPDIEKELITEIAKVDIKIREIVALQSESGRLRVEIKTPESDYVNSLHYITEQVLGRCMQIERVSQHKIRLTECPTLKVDHGVARATLGGESVSGDNYAFVPGCDGRAILALSDGMGSGEAASKQSILAVKLTKQFLKAGFSKATAARLINSMLGLKLNDETFATVDAAIIDLFNGRVDFIKMGANATYIKSGKKVRSVRSESLPAGLLDNIDAQLSSSDLKDGDYIIMISDGVEAPTKSWVHEYIKDLPNTSAQIMAENILIESKMQDHEMMDDMTVLVAKVIATESLMKSNEIVG